ncbi:TPA: radical SAM protein [Clostridium botulinum]|uniref:radical SAM protein n=1 Tax=Clostridium TaxID=1485 RepID=UPI000774BAC2|nr:MULTISPECIES: radical SAM protein [Clostridium]AUM96495.1 molybdenum cofactor biosynthesis protein MoaA [Clostridium sporogenes]AVQ53946.1 radical SAM protein [Clostridium botulinum]HBJ2613824.1 radical SAM protein [Clostridium botulinum]
MNINKFNAHEKIFQYYDKLDYFLNGYKTLISLELDLTNLCNNQCPECVGVRDNPVSLTFEQIKKLVDQLSNDFDMKSIIISGGGEPLLHPNFCEILYYIKQKGLKIGLNSNGLALNAEKAKAIIDCCSYFRISLDAGTPEIYIKTHGMNEESFNKVIKNIKMFSNMKKDLKSDISFGTGFLTSELTKVDIFNFLKLSKECGADFGQLRPFTGDFTCITNELNEAKKIFEDENFKIAASIHKYSRFNDQEKRPYKRCYGMFFNTVVTADFKVFACLHHRQDSKYFLGDLNKETMKEIWRSSRIREVFENIDCGHCPYFCRNDDMNRSLYNISKSIPHKEFL